MKSISKLSFKQQIKRRAKELYYLELKLQEYFKIPGIKTKEMLNLFKWRVRMAPFGENYRKKDEHIVCPLCFNHLDNQPTFLHCAAIRNKIPTTMEIEDIY